MKKVLIFGSAFLAGYVARPYLDKRLKKVGKRILGFSIMAMTKRKHVEEEITNE